MLGPLLSIQTGPGPKEPGLFPLHGRTRLIGTIFAERRFPVVPVPQAAQMPRPGLRPLQAGAFSCRTGQAPSHFPTTVAKVLQLRSRNLRQSIRRAEFTETVFIVQGKPREAEGIVKVVKASREDALQTAKDFLEQGLPFVTIIGDGCVYTVEEFALTVINDRTPGDQRST